MTTLPQPGALAPMAETLSADADYHESGAAEREAVIAELQQVIEAVPEHIEFSHSRRGTFLLPLLAVLSLGLLVNALHAGETLFILITAGMTLALAVMTWQHRNAGQHAFMRLTRRQLFVDTLSAPVNLADMIDIEIRHGGHRIVQKLTLRPEAPLPTHRAARALFGNQGLALTKPYPHIRIHSAGVKCAGKRLDCAEIGAIIDAHCHAARAQQQLSALQWG